MVRETLKLSLPIVPHFLLLWALQLADRFLVAVILGTTAAGLYSVASNLALPMFLIVLGFGQAFMPAYARAGKEKSTKVSLQNTIASQVAVMSALCLACAALAPPAIYLLTDRQYASAASLAPWIVLGYGFQGYYAIPMNGITLFHGNTKGLPVISGTGAAVNFGLIVWLAPIYGLEAVAIASAVGYAALLAGVCLFAIYRHARLSYPVSHNCHREFRGNRIRWLCPNHRRKWSPEHCGATIWICGHDSHRNCRGWPRSIYAGSCVSLVN